MYRNLMTAIVSMYRNLMTALVVVCMPALSLGHMVYVVPGDDGKTATVIFSDSLEPDGRVDIGKIAGLKLIALSADGKETALTCMKGKACLNVALESTPKMAYGTAVYGLLSRSEVPTLLVYHPKAVFTGTNAATIGKAAILEVVPVIADGKISFRFLVKGKPVPNAEGSVMSPDGETHAVTTDAVGYTSAFKMPGRYAAYLKWNEPKAGEHDGQKYEAVRHYATLIADLAKAEPELKDEFPPLPNAVSSLGAVASDGYLYVYGGHVGKTHTYSTKDVLGTFHRLKLDGGTEWEKLPGGPILQGMNLAVHGGKVYRVGGMRPRNASGEPKDNVSVVDAARYDPTSGKWEHLPPLPAGRSSHDLVVAEDKLVVVGGWRMRGSDADPIWADTALTLDLRSKKPEWREIPQPFRRRALTAAALGEKVYVLCGLDADADAHNRLDILDVTTGQWTTGPMVPGGRIGFSPAATVLDGHVLLNTAEGPVYRLTESGDAWETVGTSGTHRIVHRLIPYQHDCLLVGGAGKGGNVAAIERVKLAPVQTQSGN